MEIIIPLISVDIEGMVTPGIDQRLAQIDLRPHQTVPGCGSEMGFHGIGYTP